MLTLVALRRKRGLRQVELANRLGISQAFLSLIEREQYAPKQETLEQLSQIFGVTAEELMMPYEDYVIQQYESTR